MDIEVRGAEEVRQKAERIEHDLNGPPMVAGMTKAVFVVEASAKRNAPKDTGVGAASITSEIRQRDTVIEGVVGTPKPYMAYMELGTGLVRQGGGGKRHWPPGPALDTWAKRHGFESGYVVARIIGLRGGLRPRKYLQMAFERNRDRIIGFIGAAVGKIVVRR